MTWAIALTHATLLLAACGGQSTADKHVDTSVEVEKQGLLEAAIADYDQAIRLDPQLALAYASRGAPPSLS